MLDVQADMNVLDLGCGKGAALPAILDAIGSNGSVIAADRNHESLEAIQANFDGDDECERLECLPLELSKLPLPFEDNNFDRILCHNVIECIVDKVDLLNECYRILKPTGRLLVSHHDFDTAIFNSEFVNLTRDLVHGFADTTQDWQDTSDGQIGRKIPGLLTTSSFTGPSMLETMAIAETSYSPDTYGYNFSRWILDIVVKSGRIPTDDLRAWLSDLESKADQGTYYFCICLMTAIGQK